jgi:hypothetical protein
MTRWAGIRLDHRPRHKETKEAKTRPSRMGLRPRPCYARDQRFLPLVPAQENGKAFVTAKHANFPEVLQEGAEVIQTADDADSTDGLYGGAVTAISRWLSGRDTTGSMPTDHSHPEGMPAIWRHKRWLRCLRHRDGSLGNGPPRMDPPKTAWRVHPGLMARIPSGWGDGLPFCRFCFFAASPSGEFFTGVAGVNFPSALSVSSVVGPSGYSGVQPFQGWCGFFWGPYPG